MRIKTHIKCVKSTIVLLVVTILALGHLAPIATAWDWELPDPPEFDWPEPPKIDLPELPKFDWPEPPEIDLPELPTFDWPEFKWPKIEMPDFKRMLENWGKGITTGAKSVMTRVTTTVKDALNRLTASIKNSLSGITTSIKDAVSGLMTSITNALTSVATSVKNALNSLAASIRNALSGITTVVTSAFAGARSLISVLGVASVAFVGLAGAGLLIRTSRRRRKNAKGKNEPTSSQDESKCRVENTNLVVCAKEEPVRAEKEIVKEKEVLLKTRCDYCHRVYDETLDNCPHCGAVR